VRKISTNQSAGTKLNMRQISWSSHLVWKTLKWVYWPRLTILSRVIVLKLCGRTTPFQKVPSVFSQKAGDKNTQDVLINDGS